jgi:hypothetical protein
MGMRRRGRHQLAHRGYAARHHGAPPAEVFRHLRIGRFHRLPPGGEAGVVNRDHRHIEGPRRSECRGMELHERALLLPRQMAQPDACLEHFLGCLCRPVQRQAGGDQFETRNAKRCLARGVSGRWSHDGHDGLDAVAAELARKIERIGPYAAHGIRGEENTKTRKTFIHCSTRLQVRRGWRDAGPVCR